MELTEQVDGSTLTLRLSGELDMATVASFSQIVASKLSAPDVATVVVDFGGLTFIDSAGLTALVEAHEQATREQVELVLTGVSRQARKLMEVTSMLELFDIR